MSKLSINLLTFNAEKYLDACLESVSAQSFRDFSVLIIDNGSKDKTREKIEEWREIFEKERIELKTIFNETNFGFAEGHNIGFRYIGTHLLSSNTAGRQDLPHYVFCLNQDIILMPNYLEKIVKFMDEHPDCGSASGKLMRIMDDELFFDIMKNAPHSEKDEYTRHIDYERLMKECKIIDSAGIKIFKSHRAIEKGHSEEDNGQYDKIKEVFGVTGTAPIFRWEALEDIKFLPCGKGKCGCDGKSSLPEYFDNDFESYKEDVDISYRLRWRGWKIFVAPEAIAFHKRGVRQLKKSLGDFTAAFNRKNKPKYINYLSQRNQIWFLIKNLDKLNFQTFWYEFKKFGYELLFEWTTFKAWLDIWGKMEIMKEKREWIMRNRKISPIEMNRWLE